MPMAAEDRATTLSSPKSVTCTTITIIKSCCWIAPTATIRGAGEHRSSAREGRH
jgi:hypothetical protein